MGDFFELLARLPEAARNVINDAMALDQPTLTDVHRLVRQHDAPEHVVLAVYGYLPTSWGDYFHVYCTTSDVYILDEAHKAAWQLNRLAAQPTANIVWCV